MTDGSQLIDTLERLIISLDPKTREEAARSLGSIVVHCIHQLKSKEPRIQQQAWHQWRRFRASNAVEALLEASEDDPADEVRRAAQFALDAIICASGIQETAPEFISTSRP